MTQAAALGAGGLCSAWVNVGCSLVAGLCGFLALSVRGPRAELSAPLLEEEEERKPRLGPPALLLFALEAMPSMGPTLTNVEFWLLFARRKISLPSIVSTRSLSRYRGARRRARKPPKASVGRNESNTLKGRETHGRGGGARVDVFCVATTR